MFIKHAHKKSFVLQSFSLVLALSAKELRVKFKDISIKIYNLKTLC